MRKKHKLNISFNNPDKTKIKITSLTAKSILEVLRDLDLGREIGKYIVNGNPSAMVEDSGITYEYEGPEDAE